MRKLGFIKKNWCRCTRNYKLNAQVRVSTKFYRYGIPLGFFFASVLPNFHRSWHKSPQNYKKRQNSIDSLEFRSNSWIVWNSEFPCFSRVSSIRFFKNFGHFLQTNFLCNNTTSLLSLTPFWVHVQVCQCPCQCLCPCSFSFLLSFSFFVYFFVHTLVHTALTCSIDLQHGHEA